MLKDQRSVEKFLGTLTELVESKYSAAEGLIRRALEELAESPDLREAMEAVTRDFDYPVARARYLRYPASKGALHGAAYLPVERSEIVAFVFCLLMDLDGGTFVLADFLPKYFYVDGSYTAAYQRFADRMLRPFRDILRDAFSGEQEGPAAAGAQEPYSGFLSMLSAESERLATFSLREEERRAAGVLVDGMHAAATGRDAAMLRALAEGYRYFLRYFGGEDERSEAFFRYVASL